MTLTMDCVGQLVEFTGMLAKLCLDGIVVRDLVRESSLRDVYLGSAFWMKLARVIATLVVTVFTT